MDEVFIPPFVVNDLNPVLPHAQTADWGLVMLDIPFIHQHYGLTGKGIKVAVIDTMPNVNHVDLDGKIVKVFNTTNEKGVATNHHSTGVCGVIAAKNNDTGVLGVAPDAQIIAIKALGEGGSGDLEDVVQAIRVAIKEKVHIINLSLGSSSTTPSMENAIKDAAREGIVIVAAAGNSGKDNDISYPARYEEVFAVGALNQYGQVSAFSSRGGELDICAPGERILTTWKTGYSKVSGTSFASPFIAGVFALFLEAKIKISHGLIAGTAKDIGEAGYDTKAGHGLIDAVKVISSSLTPPPDDGDDTPIEIDVTPVKEAYEKIGKFLKEVEDATRK